MGFIRYSVPKEENSARAQFHDLDASYKDLTQICRAIRYKKVDKAFEILEGAIEGKKAIQYFKFSKGCGHRSELGGKKGRYPKKECRLMKKLLTNAVANAVDAGLKREGLKVKHALANKQNTFKRYRFFWPGSVVLGYGKNAVWANYQTAWAELVLSGEKSEEKKEKKEQKQKKEPAKKEEQSEQKGPQKPTEKKVEEKKEAQQQKEKKTEAAEGKHEAHAHQAQKETQAEA